MARLTSVSADDILVCAQTVYGEARGEPYHAKVAVAWVMVNRCIVARAHLQRTGKPRPNFGDGSLASVCKAPWQFSCWNKGDPNRPKMEALSLPASLTDEVFRDCLSAALAVIDGRESDATAGSTHYHTIAMGWPAAWGEKQVPVCAIGAHVFYNTVK